MCNFFDFFFSHLFFVHYIYCGFFCYLLLFNVIPFSFEHWIRWHFLHFEFSFTVCVLCVTKHCLCSASAQVGVAKINKTNKPNCHWQTTVSVGWRNANVTNSLMRLWQRGRTASMFVCVRHATTTKKRRRWTTSKTFLVPVIGQLMLFSILFSCFFSILCCCYNTWKIVSFCVFFFLGTP